MAFHTILDGSNCGPSNPLQNLLKHADHHPLSSRFGQSNQAHTTSNPHQASSSSHLNNQNQASFLMNGIQNELDSINSSSYPHQRPVNQTWRNQFASSALRAPISADEAARMERSFRSLVQQPVSSQAQSEDWTHRFAKFDNPHTPLQSSDQNHGIISQYPAGMPLASRNVPLYSQLGMRNQNLSLFSPMNTNPPMMAGQSFSLQNGHAAQMASTRIVELSDSKWEAEFAKFGDQLDNQTDHQATKSDREQSTSTETIGLESPSVQDPETTEEDLEADAEFLRSLEATWKGLAENLNLGSQTIPTASNWADITEDDFIDSNLNAHPSTRITPENVADFLENPEPYPFQSNNPFLDHLDPFQEGHRLIQSGATLSEAALAFEAACQLDENRAEAWRMLGETQAADEKEQLAIKAFQKAVGCRDPSDQSAWLSLAICWVNEGQEMRALAILERWLMDAYPAIAASALPAMTAPDDQNNPWARHGMVVEKFIQAARAGPEAREGAGKEKVGSQVVDVDVQVALGVLFYSNGEYERARDCFEAGLGVDAGDFALWNRLGATLANGGRPEEAIAAYERALALRPTFTRAIYNLGVSCLNIHCYSQAVQHLLAALSCHAKAAAVGSRPLLSDGDGSENLWFTLRRAFLCLDRSDLADLATPNTNIEVFREHGFDF